VRGVAEAADAVGGAGALEAARGGLAVGGEQRVVERHLKHRPAAMLEEVDEDGVGALGDVGRLAHLLGAVQARVVDEQGAVEVEPGAVVGGSAEGVLPSVEGDGACRDEGEVVVWGARDVVGEVVVVVEGLDVGVADGC